MSLFVCLPPSTSDNYSTIYHKSIDVYEIQSSSTILLHTTKNGKLKSKELSKPTQNIANLANNYDRGYARTGTLTDFISNRNNNGHYYRNPYFNTYEEAYAAKVLLLEQFYEDRINKLSTLVDKLNNHFKNVHPLVNKLRNNQPELFI